MELRQYPLCWVRPESGVIEHLVRDHRRSEVEARTLVERINHGSLGWNAEGVQKGTGLPLGPAKRMHASGYVRGA